MAVIAHAALAFRSSQPSPVSAWCFSSGSPFACASWHQHKIPESVDELTGHYNRRNHSILGRPSSIKVTFPIGRLLIFERKSGRSEASKFSGFWIYLSLHGLARQKAHAQCCGSGGPCRSVPSWPRYHPKVSLAIEPRLPQRNHFEARKRKHYTSIWAIQQVIVAAPIKFQCCTCTLGLVSALQFT
jgi:hypothetical protein